MRAAYDVVIVGYGPTGMLAAILLGRAGHEVAVVERHRSLYNLPRVGIVHDDVLRMFQEIGCIDQVLPATRFLPVYELARNGRVLLSSEVAPEATHGWPEYLSVYQPAFERELDRLARAEPSVTPLQGETAVGLSQDADTVTVTTTGSDGHERSLVGRYAIGADGGNSFVRRALGVEYEDLGFDQDWLVVDGRETRPRAGLPAMRQICEPEQPGVTLAMGPHHRRWSFMIFPGESPETAVEPANVWRRLDRPEGATPDELELVRVAAYRFRSLCAERWAVGRVFLAGDAAHQMPPFLAQGLCSGLRDVHNLSWKLDLVLRGRAGEALLDSYVEERGPHVRATIVESMRVGRIVNERDPERLRQRDAELLARQAEQRSTAGQEELIAYRVPGYAAGAIARGGVPGAGDAFLQRRVRLDGRDGRFDDIAGRGFLVLARDDPSPVLRPDDLAVLRAVGGRVLQVVPDGPAPAEGGRLVDLDGDYGRLFDAYACEALVKRPDHYLFGTARHLRDLPALLADLQGQLRASPSAGPAERRG